MNLRREVIVAVFILIHAIFISAQADSLLRKISLSSDNIEKISLYTEISDIIPIEDTLNKLAYADSALYLAEKQNSIEDIISARHNKARVLQAYKNYHNALHYYLSAIKLSKLTKDLSELADLYYNIGTLYYRMDSFQLSVDAHKKALLISKSKNDTSGILNAEQAIAVMLWRMGKLKEAEKHYLISLDIAKGMKDSLILTNVINSLGAVYWGYGNFHSAFKYFNQAAQLSSASGNYRKLSLIMCNIGLIYYEWGELNKAMNEFKEALKIAKKEDYTYSIAYAYINIGEVYLKLNKYENARVYYDSSLVNYRKISKKIGMAFSYRNIAKTYMLMKNYEQAIKYYNLAIETAKEVNTRHHWAIALQGLAQTYFELNNFSLAKKYAFECLKISKVENYKNIIKDIYFLLSDIAEKEHKPASALMYYKKASILKDSVFNESHGKQIAEMQAKYEIEKAERENAFLRKEEQVKNLEIKANQSKIRFQSIFLSVLLIILAVTGILIIKLLQTRKKLLESQKLLLEKNNRINHQKEELFVQSKNLTEINLLLNDRTIELEKKTKQLQKNIEEIEKAAQFKNKMFSIIGHDLRGPLGTIHSIISLALNKELTEQSREKLLNSVKESSVSAYNLLENLLTWANNEQGKISFEPQNINLKRVVQNSCDLLFETAKKKFINFNISIEENCMVLADYNMLDTIIRNLLSNAIKFSFENSKIDISAENKGEFVDISVRDYGIGMNEEELKHVLDKDMYFSSFGTKQEKGTGIGLQLCFEFIKANGGIFRIISQKGEGTNFIFSLRKANEQ
ncbi:MAG: tetratricopeptide repeat-containing sensor histidine kinase [Bacteroidales bacterium]|nr:tetratricopeptide repeat-containing sensor histidine kinase [Bacteroidales bacterium]